MLTSDFLENPTVKSPEGDSARIIADHLRSSVVILGDKISPSNTDQGYILRRLIRRAIRHGKKLKIKSGFTVEIAKIVIDKLGVNYLEIKENSEMSILWGKEAKFYKNYPSIANKNRQISHIHKEIVDFTKQYYQRAKEADEVSKFMDTFLVKNKEVLNTIA